MTYHLELSLGHGVWLHELFLALVLLGHLLSLLSELLHLVAEVLILDKLLDEQVVLLIADFEIGIGLDFGESVFVQELNSGLESYVAFFCYLT